MSTTEKPARIGFREETDHGDDHEHDHGDDMGSSVGSDADMFDDDHDHEGQHDDDDAQPSFAKNGKKKSKGAMKLIVGSLAVFFVVVLGGGSFIIYKNKMKAKEGSSDAVVSLPAQPAITALPPAGSEPVPGVPGGPIGAPVPVVAGDVQVASASVAAASAASADGGASVSMGEPTVKSAPAPVQKSAAAVVERAAEPVAAPSRAASGERSSLKLGGDSGTSNDAAAAQNAAAVIAMRHEISEVQEAVKSLAQQIASVKNDIKSMSANRAVATPAPDKALKATKAESVVVKESTAPVKTVYAKPARVIVVKRAVPEIKNEQVTAVKADLPKEEIIAPSSGNKCVTAIVNNLAYITRRAADGTESEQTVVAGDKIDGRSVVAVDSRSKTVLLDGGGRITTNCQR